MHPAFEILKLITTYLNLYSDASHNILRWGVEFRFYDPETNCHQCICFYRGNSYAGIRALHCNARINSHAFYSSCSSNGRKQCKVSSSFHFSCLNLSYNLFYCSWILWLHLLILSCLEKQRDKARVIQTLLFMSGLNTLLQTFVGSRLPTVMNASFAFLIPVMSIIRDFALRPFADEHEVHINLRRLNGNVVNFLINGNVMNYYWWLLILSGDAIVPSLSSNLFSVWLQRFVHTMRAIQGALIVSSFLNIIIGYSRAWGKYTRCEGWYCLDIWHSVPAFCVI